MEISRHFFRAETADNIMIIIIIIIIIIVIAIAIAIILQPLSAYPLSMARSYSRRIHILTVGMICDCERMQIVVPQRAATSCFCCYL